MRLSSAEVICSVFSDVPNKQNAGEDLVRLTSDENSDVRYLAISILGSSLSDISDKKQGLNDYE